jgi:single-stranded DNA-binding protein
MTTQIATSGRLGAAPKTSKTKTDTSMAFASIAVNMPKRSNVNDDGEHTLWLSLVAFGKTADTLARHERGDLISISGRLQISEYQPETGELRSDFQVIVDSIVSARSVQTPRSAEQAFHEAGETNGPF